jgi:hypothetical protein
MNTPKKFWTVWGEGKAPGVVQHPTHEAAMTEAMRLARNHQRAFYVMEAVGIARAVAPPVEYVMVQQSDRGFAV